MIRVALVLATLAGLLPHPAQAHAVLVSSTPALDAVMPPGKIAMMLHYNSRIDHVRSRIVLTGPDHQQARLPITNTTDGDDLTADANLITPGAYVLRWQVLAVDGHISRGNVPFTVKAP